MSRPSTLLALGLLAAACGSPNKNSSNDAGAGDAAMGACGNPGDMGVNSLGVGKYCQTSNDCPSTAPICSTIESSFLPADAGVPPTNFCLIPLCDPCSPIVPQCGADTICACFAQGECGCAPASCSNIVPAGLQTPVCSDGGMDAGSDAGLDGGSDAGLDGGSDEGDGGSDAGDGG